MATGTEIKEKISELPVLPGSLDGFYVLGSKDNESGQPESYKCNLGFVEAAANAANEAAGVAQEKASLAQTKAEEAAEAASMANEKAGEAEQAKQNVLEAQETIEVAERERTSAETARSEAEEARVEAEQERQEAETSRRQAERPYSSINKVAGPLFDVTYPSLDYAYAKDYFENHAPEVTPAGCSVLVKDGILVRSYDWKRKTADGKTPCSFAVHTPAAQGHFAVVGMAGGLDALTEDVVEARQFSEAYKILPFCMLDGKNEKELFAEMNVVPTWHNTRTMPAVEKRESISAMMLVRYILDNFQTVDEAVAYLQNYIEVYMPTNLDEMGFELHFLIADATKSVAIEFVDNSIVAIETDKLTNFHLSGVTLNEDGSVYTNADVAEGNLPSSQGIEDYGTGLERFNILNSATDPVEAIKAVVYSKAYTDLVNVWFSEFVGGDITVDTRTENEDFLARIAEYRQKWEDQDNDVWISVHQSIYRLGVAGLDVAIREGSDEHFVPISDHAQAQSDHSLAENDHSTAQQDHTQAASDHSQAESDHQTATQDHNQAGTDHEQASDDHDAVVQATEECTEAKEAIEANEIARQTAEAARVAEEERRVQEYGEFELDINEGFACIEGHRDLPDWQEDEYGFSLQTWLPGQYCKHPWTNPETHVTKNYVYRFTKAVAEGERWDVDKVVQTSVFGELKELIVGDEENLHVILSSSDGELDVEGLNVNIVFDDGSATRILTTNEDGEAGTAIAKGKVFSVQVADQTGYQHVPTQKFKANSNERYVYMIYQKEISSETSDITVSLSAQGSQQGVTPFVGKTVSLILSNNQSASSVVDSTGVAAFSGIPQGLTGYVILPAIAGFRVPSRIEFSTNYATIGLNAVYTIQIAGLYMVNQDGEEVDFYGWDENDTLIALHIATQELLDRGKDYYVDPSMLDTSWFTSAHNKPWATNNVNFPNVPGDSGTDYDGQSNTANMLSDAETLGIQSPVAEFWTSQTLTISGNVKLGYGGTKRNWQPMIDNHAAIDDMLLLGGFTPGWYNKNIWTSTQYSATHAWYWTSGSWGNKHKVSSFAAVPFFAI